MDDLLAKLLAGVDLGSPDASWQLLLNLMALMPWRLLVVSTVICVAVACAIARYRGGKLWPAACWALLLGPLAWPIAWAQGRPIRPCPRCATPVPAGRAHCPHCGCRVEPA